MEFKEITYRGKKRPLSFKMAIGRIGDVEVEWVQPVKGKSIFDEFLRRHGDGIHHLAFAVPTPEKLDEQLQYFKSKGVTPVQQGTWQGTKGQGHFAFLDLGAQGGGLTLELLCNPDLLPAGSTSENEYPLNKLLQYGPTVWDLRKVNAYYEQLGFGRMQFAHVDVVQPTFRGQPGKYDMILGWWNWQSLSGEWIAPLVGPSVYDEYLEKHGEGVHHIAFVVSDMDAALAMMKDKGVAVAQGGGIDVPAAQGGFAYFDTDAHGGVTLEFVWGKPRNP
jgi:catechol 2,3-dioxygenase-like lactoylglutathione lyase family enzyme